MAFMKIHCGYCNQSWEIYERNWKEPRANCCPHCQQEIDRQTWERQVLPAFHSVADANRELFKDHVGYHRPLYTFDVVADHIFPERSV